MNNDNHKVTSILGIDGPVGESLLQKKIDPRTVNTSLAERDRSAALEGIRLVRTVLVGRGPAHQMSEMHGFLAIGRDTAPDLMTPGVDVVPTIPLDSIDQSSSTKSVVPQDNSRQELLAGIRLCSEQLPGFSDTGVGRESSLLRLE